MLAALRAACTPDATAAATADVYVAVLPPLTRVCDRLLDRTALSTWKTAEDLAEDTLVDTLPLLQRGACLDVQNSSVWSRSTGSGVVQTMSQATRSSACCATVSSRGSSGPPA